MSNSPLICYKKISPNKSSPRNHKIDKITIHHMGCNLSIEALGNEFARSDRGASSNYGIGSDGRIALYVDEKDRSWCSDNRDNDNRAVTIEVANDGKGPDWHVSDAALESLINLCLDICERNDIPGLNYTYDVDGNLTRHNMFAYTTCPGPYLESKFQDIVYAVNARLGSEEEKEDCVEPEVMPVIPEELIDSSENTTKEPLIDPSLLSTPEYKIVEEVGPLFTADQKKTGVLACVSMAQYILESGWGRGELAKKANNFFSMKCSLSGNTWTGSTWDGVSSYDILTGEYINGSYVTSTGYFRKYANMADSIADHSAYLLGAMKGSSKRYEGLKGETEYKKAVQLIKDGGYATDPNYVSKLNNLIEKWALTRFNYDPGKEVKVEPEYELVDVDKLQSIIDKIALDVIRGLYGNGEERKLRLAGAGYDYQTIQNRVNEMLLK